MTRRASQNPGHDGRPSAEPTAAGSTRGQRSRTGPRATAQKRETQKRETQKARPHAPEAGGRWSAAVTHGSDALDLRPGVFTLEDPKAIARSLKASAEESTRRKAEPYRSAMSMLTFFINRAGSNLEPKTRRTLEQAKVELRRLYGRPAHPR